MMDMDDATTLIILILYATYSVGTNIENNRPISKYNGAPGGCGICSIYEHAIRSAQSQKLVVGGIVSRYSMNAEINAVIAKYLFKLL